MSVALRPTTRADRRRLREWLPGVARTAGYTEDVDLLLEPRAGRHDRVIERDGAPIGLIAWRRPGRERSALVELVATEPEHARRGAGMQAAAMLEAALYDAGVRRVYAPASAAHGISLYFWIRLGYRPLMRGDWPCTVDGVTWLARDL